MWRKLTAVGKLFQIPWRDRLLLFEAVVVLALARLATWLLPFRWLAPFLGRKMAESPETDPTDVEPVRRIEWAVSVARRYGPWGQWCLAEAIAGKALLRRRGLTSTLYLGVLKGDDGELEAHAWLRCGSRILIGESAIRGHAVIAKFAEES